MKFKRREFIKPNETRVVHISEVNEKVHPDGREYLEITLEDISSGEKMRDFINASFGEKEESLFKAVGLDVTDEEFEFQPTDLYGKAVKIKTGRGKKMNNANEKAEGELTDSDFFPVVEIYSAQDA